MVRRKANKLYHYFNVSVLSLSFLTAVRDCFHIVHGHVSVTKNGTLALINLM